MRFTKRKVQRGFGLVIAAQHHAIHHDVARVEHQVVDTSVDNGGNMLDKAVHGLGRKVNIQL